MLRLRCQKVIQGFEFVTHAYRVRLVVRVNKLGKVLPCHHFESLLHVLSANEAVVLGGHVAAQDDPRISAELLQLTPLLASGDGLELGPGRS